MVGPLPAARKHFRRGTFIVPQEIGNSKNLTKASMMDKHVKIQLFHMKKV